MSENTVALAQADEPKSAGGEGYSNHRVVRRRIFGANWAELNGDYAGSLKVSGIANAPTAAEAINFSTQSAAPVPEPGTWAAAALLAGGAAFARWRQRGKSA